MSNQDRLLSDEELERAIRKLVRWGDHDKGYGIANYEELAALINTQKRLYAESVIGEDEKDNRNLNGNLNIVKKKNYRNQLRAEQRASIK